MLTNHTAMVQMYKSRHVDQIFTILMMKSADLYILLFRIK